MATINLTRRTAYLVGAIVAVVALGVGLAVGIGGSSRPAPKTAAALEREIGPFTMDGYLCDKVQGFKASPFAAADGAVTMAQDWLPDGKSLPNGTLGLSCATAYLFGSREAVGTMDAIIPSGLPSIHGPSWVISLGAPVPRSVLRMIEQRTGGVAG